MKLQTRKTIAIDMDGVMADVEPQLIKYYEQLYGITTTLEAIDGLSHAEAFPLDAVTKASLNLPGFFRTPENTHPNKKAGVTAGLLQFAVEIAQ